MANWTYDTETQKENALSEAGYKLWQTLGDINGFGWAEEGEEWSEWITRFTSRQQATSYAYQMVVELGRTI